MAGSSVIGALRVNLGLDAAQFTKGLKRSKQQMSGFQKDIVAIGAKITGALAAAFSVRAMGQAADAWSDMSSRVGVAVGNMQAAPEIMERIHKIAQMTYSPLQQTADGFAENNAALKGLGYSTDQALDYTEALNNALVVSGAKGERAASVARALSVALATGKLSGDGLNSVLSNGGEIAELLAAQLGTSRNGLIKMAQQGKITGDVIVKSLIGNMDDLREKAGEMPATIADGFQKIGNSFTGLIGRMDQAIGASGAFAEVLGKISEGMDAAADFLVANADTIITALNTLLATGALVAAYFAGQFAVGFIGGAAGALKAAWTQMVALNLALGAGSVGAARMGAATKMLQAALIGLRGALISTGIGALVVAAGYLIAKFIDIVRWIGGLGNAFSLLGEVVSGVWEGIKGSAQSIPVALAGVWESVKAGFYSLMESLLIAWSRFMFALGVAAEAAGLDSLKKSFDDARNIATTAGADWGDDAAKAGAAAEAKYAEAAALATDGFTQAAEALGKLNVVVSENEDATGGAAAGIDNFTEKAGGGGAKKLTKFQEVMKALNEEAARLKATLFMNDLDTSIWEKQTEAGVTAESAAGKQIDMQMRQIDGFKRLKDATNEWRDSIKGAFASFVSGASSFKDMLGQIIAKFAEMLANSAFDALFDGFGGNKLLAGIGGIFGGFRAAGGSVSGGTSYIVGEKGPELFTPGQSGMITPNHALGGGGHISIGFDKSTGSLTAVMYDVAGRVVSQATPGMIGQAVQKTGQAMSSTKAFGSR